MSIGKFCNRTVVTAPRDATIVEAAHLMRRQHVGDVVVVDEVDGGVRPVGIITDRDIVVEVVSAGLDAAQVKVGELVVQPLVTIQESASYAETVHLMSAKGVRRMPVVDAAGRLAGIITHDDLVAQLVNPLAELSALAQRERRHEAATRK